MNHVANSRSVGAVHSRTYLTRPLIAKFGMASNGGGDAAQVSMARTSCEGRTMSALTRPFQSADTKALETVSARTATTANRAGPQADHARCAIQTVKTAI